jgi:succinate dehydrogenase / fumarate reductase membrane anchor subunit
LRAWVVQRVSGAYIALCVIVLGIAIALSPAVTYDAWRGWFVRPSGNIAAALFFVAIALHAWVGVRDVVIDYVHVAALRFLLLGVALITLSASLLWALRVLWSLPIA